MICLFSIKIYGYWAPLRDDEDDMLQELAQWQLFSVLFAALLQNVDATGDSSADQQALGWLLILFIIPVRNRAQRAPRASAASVDRARTTHHVPYTHATYHTPMPRTTHRAPLTVHLSPLSQGVHRDGMDVCRAVLHESEARLDDGHGDGPRP